MCNKFIEGAEITFILRSPGDWSVGISDYHQEVTMKFKYSEFGDIET